MIAEKHWTPTASESPARYSRVEWICPNGNLVRGRYYGDVATWVAQDNWLLIGVPYTPTHWRYLDEGESATHPPSSAPPGTSCTGTASLPANRDASAPRG